jgi:subfamily B ATP-binding cassette protein MsbA
MNLKFENNFIGYFKFYYRILGNKLFISLLLSVTVSFLDGIGLTMFMPLLQSVGESDNLSTKKTMGYLHYVTDFIKHLGFEISIYTLLLSLVILFISKGVVKFFQQNYQVKLRLQFMNKVRFLLTHQLQNLTYEGFLSFNAGKIQNGLTTEVTRLRIGMAQYISTFQSIMMLLTYIFLAFLANWKFAILVAVGAGLSNLLFRKIFTITKKASISISQKGDKFNSYLIQAIHNFKYLKSTNYFSSYSLKLKKIIHESELLDRRIGFFQAITSSVKEPILMVIISLVIIIQIKWLGSSLSSILLSLLLFYRALSFLMMIQTSWQTFIQNIGSMYSISEIATQMEGLAEPYNPNMFTHFEEQIALKNVSFNYGTTRILDSINLTIPKNQTVALVGESGSGKTTIANLIASLIQPSEGELQVDNVSLSNYNFNSYRDKIGYISQEPVIFNDTIFNNITFWAEPTPEAIKHFWHIVELTSLSAFVQSLDEKENTHLGDNGILISGGQKQRISIARELFKKAELLILDEATSSLDSETEKVIQENIDKLHGNFTILIIAHRLSTIKNTDCIFLLENGKVTGSGRFEDLSKSSARFKRMVELQIF